MTNLQRARLTAFIEHINGMDAPLGDSFETGCWGAVAFEIAATAEQQPTEYFGISEEQLNRRITMNAQTPAPERNLVMAAATEEFV